MTTPFFTSPMQALQRSAPDVSRLKSVATLYWLPATLLGIYAGARLMGVRGATDLDGISAVLRVVFLAFGASVAYLMTLLPGWKPFRRIRTRLWLLTCGWFVVSIADDSFMLHEQIGLHYDIKDSIPLMVVGVALLAILAAHRHRMCSVFWGFFLAFGALSAVALVSDVLFVEGIVYLGGFGFDYEQATETLAVLSLVCGFTAQAIHELTAAVVGLARPESDEASSTERREPGAPPVDDPRPAFLPGPPVR